MSSCITFRRKLKKLIAICSLSLMLLLNTWPVGAQGGPLLSVSETDINATSDVAKNFTLPDGFVLSGTIKTTTGQPVFGGTVTAISGSRRYGGPIQANPAGTSTYRVILAAGTYSVTAQVFQIDTTTFSAATVTFDVMSGLSITGNRTLDITVTPLPTFSVTGKVTSAGILPTKGTIQFTSADGKVSVVAQFDGSYRVAVPAGTYAVFVYLSLNNQASNLSLSLPTVSVSGATTKDLALPPAFNVLGTIKTNAGTVAAPSSFSAFDATQAPPNTTFGVATVPSSSTTGAFALPLPGGSYNTASTIEINFGGNVKGTLGFNSLANPLAVNADMTVNVLAPATPASVIISGKVSNSSGAGVGGASISAFTSSVTGIQNGSFSASTMTATDGSYSLKVLSGTGYTIIVVPRNP